MQSIAHHLCSYEEPGIMQENLSLEKLLGRERKEYPLPDLEGKVVMVTGAGGFIGSHLCKMLLKAKCKTLILLDSSEYNLYTIHRQLEAKNTGIKIIPVLGTYSYKSSLRAVKTFAPEVVLHVGAYKHVPMVERNPLSALENNVLEFLPFCISVKEVGSSFVVVSSDKAVNPTNVMGATKRLVEAVALKEGPHNTKIVRFGNVMWSSGSVLPLFTEQLKAGKEVTLTHKEVDRYFMTAHQACSLVLSTLQMKRGIYALNMGEPVKIVQLIARLAEALEIPSYTIKEVGLRHGEKLHEELTLGESLHPTSNPEILEARENPPQKNVLEKGLKSLKDAVENQDIGEVRVLLKKLVPGYNPMCGIVEDAWLQENVLTLEEKFGDPYAPTEEAK